MKTTNILSNKRLSIALHFAAWTIIAIIPRYLINTYGDGNEQFINHLYINLAVYGFLFYLNYLFLVPKLLFNDLRWQYFLVASLFITAIGAVMWYINENLFFDFEREKQIKELIDEINKDKEVLKPPIKQFKLVNYVSTSFLVLGFSLGLKLLEKLGQNERERKELEKEKLNSELAFLKSQISPHFFFNTLNNIFSLIDIDTEKAKNSVLKLSKLMRYLLYESDKGETLLSDEIEFMKHYIDLMKLRLNSKVKLSVSLPDELPSIKIPPLLFISFIENAFKHGVSYREPSFIVIKMSILNDQVVFINKNSIRRTNRTEDKKYSGIGLENVKKRLNLLFPKNHRLTISENENVFSVELTLETDMKK